MVSTGVISIRGMGLLPKLRISNRNGHIFEMPPIPADLIITMQNYVVESANEVGDHQVVLVLCALIQHFHGC